MNKKDLTDLGIAEDIAEKIVILHGKDIEKQKTAIETSKTEADGLKAQLVEANKAIEGFKGMDIEGVKKSANEWKLQAEQAQADAAKQISTLKFDHALDGALTGAKAKNAKAVKALLQTDVLKLQEDGTIFGLDEQLKTVKEANDYLFESDTPNPRIVLGGGNKLILSDAVVDAARKAAGLPPPK
jgi:hypothetical protein